MDGTCDVPGCTNETYMGWRPLNQPKGKQICEDHWTQHKDPADSFNLWDAFGFKRPAKRLTGPLKEKPEIARRAKERQVQGGKKKVPLISGEAPIETDDELAALAHVSHDTIAKAAKIEAEPVQGRGPRCRACGGSREAGHTYCRSCAAERRTITRRQAQSRYWRKQHVSCGSD